MEYVTNRPGPEGLDVVLALDGRQLSMAPEDALALAAELTHQVRVSLLHEGGMRLCPVDRAERSYPTHPTPSRFGSLSGRRILATRSPAGPLFPSTVTSVSPSRRSTTPT